MDLQSIYDENYYENYYNTGLGPIAYDRSNPQWLWFFGNIADKIIKDIKPKTVLDVGCAKGFLVESFRDRGVEAFGIDISEYAISEVRQDIKKYCKVTTATEKLDGRYDLITCIEVLEHLTEQDSQKVIENICQSTDDVIFSSTPDDFSEKTHINVQPLTYWIESFARHGFYLDVYDCYSFIIAHAMRFRKMNYSSAIYNFRSSVQEKDAFISQLNEKNAKLENDLIQLVNSRSWRFTKPLRKLMKYFKKIFKTIKREKFKFEIKPINELEKVNDDKFNYNSLGIDPFFYLEPLKHRYPGNWVKIFIEINNIISPLVLYFDTGNSFNEGDKLLIYQNNNKKNIKGYAKIPYNIKAIKLVPQAVPGKFYIGEVYIQELTKVEIAIRLLFKTFYEELKNFNGLINKIKIESFNDYNIILKIKNRIKNKLLNHYNSSFNYDYINYINSCESEDVMSIKKNINDILNTFKISPLISIIMPTYNTPREYLTKAIESVINQIYPNWELCIADDASTEIHVKEILKYYKEKDERIKVIYRTENGHISKASNSALSIATGDYIALLDHDDELPESALFFAVKEINEHSDVKLIYSDEDKLDINGKRVNPYFKTDWNPDLFLSQNMINHLGVYKKSIIDEIGGFREGYEGSQDYDLALRFIEKIKYSEIRHIPRILYHWRMTEGSTAVNVENKSYAVIAARKAIQEHLDRMHIKAKAVEAPLMPVWSRVIYDIDKNPLVSIIIPTYNGYDILKNCIGSIIEKTSYKNYEIIVVNNNCDDEQTVKYLESINTLSNIKVIDYNKPFNYSAINNFAVKSAKGDVLVLLNNDTEVINDDWLRELVSHALRPEIGAVGAKLLYPDNTIQHAGVIIGFGGAAGHCHYKINNEDTGYYGRANLLQNYSAVTGACMVIKKELYQKVNGLDENLAVAFNDIDFCLKILELGYYNVYSPYALLYHHESKSRGFEDTAEKQSRFREEVNYFNKKWKNIIEYDPFYNPNLTLDANCECFSLSFKPRIKLAMVNQ